MSYIGRGTESISNVEVLDNLTFNGSASYTLQKSSVNFVPSSANNLLISISGVVQQGNFSVSGSTITFDTTVSGTDTCDWILHYGTGLITTVADGAITEAKLGSNAVTTAKINNGAITSAKLDSGLALGKIGQVVNGTTNYDKSSTSTSYVDFDSASGVPFEVSITPSSTSSSILSIYQMQLLGYRSGGADGRGTWQCMEKIGSGSYAQFKRGYEQIGTYDYGNSGVFKNDLLTITSLRNPNTTDTVTYKLQYQASGGGGGNIVIAQNHNATALTVYSEIILMEVLA